MEVWKEGGGETYIKGIREGKGETADEGIIQNGKNRSAQKGGEKIDKRVNFVLTHSGYLPNVNKILKRHGHYLEEDGLGQYVKELPRLSLRRGKNLGDLIVNAKARQEEGGSGPCVKDCKLCKHMQATEVVKEKDGKDMKLEKKIDCRTIGVIYGMHCKACKKIVYVGKTKNRLMETGFFHLGKSSV